MFADQAAGLRAQFKDGERGRVVHKEGFTDEFLDFEEDSEADIVSEDVIERPETPVVTNIQNTRENQEPHKLEETKGSAPVVETKNEDSGGSINDFMGDF